MPAPNIVPRQSHGISRRNIDRDALKVLYRLHEHKHLAYLVGGSVRDLILGRHPKDFDIGTDAHPYQIKKLFRNCWVIGRRFRLAHVKFGPKTIEVATFRRVVAEVPAPQDQGSQAADARPETPSKSSAIHRDNTFGTPEEDAFRRDFTINGLFYDIATYSVIDYVGGLEDLEKRVVRSIGDPHVRFVEDPVRMLRAAVMAARLDFELDPLVIEAVAAHRRLLATASPARLLEEYYKILRSGFAEATFRKLIELRLLEQVTPELKKPRPALWESLARLDAYRTRFRETPSTLTNAVLIGALLSPLGILGRTDSGARADRTTFGILPLARKDIERHQQVAQMLPRLTDQTLPPRTVRGLLHRPALPDALVSLEIRGDASDHVARWQEAREQAAAAGPRTADRSRGSGDDGTRPRRRRRRRRRRGPGRGETTSGNK